MRNSVTESPGASCDKPHGVLLEHLITFHSYCQLSALSEWIT